MPLALYALAAGAFGIGTTEFVIMGLLLQVGRDLHVDIAAAGLLISGYALGVFVGAPLLTVASGRLPRKTVLLGLMAIFTLGNLACALAPDYGWLMAARVVTSLAHGTFFGVSSVVAAGLVAPDRRASAISLMFTGLTLATLLGVPVGTWLGHLAGWRATFLAVAAIGVAALIVIAALVPAHDARHEALPLRTELRAVAQPAVLLGLATTVLGFAGVFTVFTYVQPLLTRVSGYADAAVSPILLLVGVGLVLGNLLGGRAADRRLAPALVGTLLALAATLVFTGVALHARLPAVLAMLLFGIAAFATVAPLQLWVLQKAAGAPNLASSLNIGAFNLGNALGAWLGGTVIERGAGLAVVPYAGALVTLAGAAVAMAGLRAARPAPARLAACER
ncbi:MFS transporter [Frateuria terrea]|uniref:MFS transporter, DHA1 family, arabinose polymer transporter n=1 Tax=Frateuria terrea TaxID=529704 RepID=A0A1H6WTZ7_9GAMM|nr:MFS transporter [Frateuria terrea]SEJ16300.1 MFS transporter, DHA1 family, arabinose polymer transporter [Frateuria terrea]SFP55729.1 MFS transporter, DHA1 family, arabinose polymer transporter [Frateuria terrea]